MVKILLGTNTYDAVYTEKRDSGGMFKDTVGVIKSDSGFHAFVRNGWGGGAMSRLFATEGRARQEVDRLWERVYGE